MVAVRNNQSGYIALLTILIVGAVTTAVALTLLLGGADNQRTSLVTQQSAQARALASACAEEALQVLRDNNSYTGTSGLTLPTGNCSYVVTNGSGTRSVLATGTVQNVVRKIQVYATLSVSSISVISWQEVI
jgi:hypothetical protein